MLVNMRSKLVVLCTMRLGDQLGFNSKISNLSKCIFRKGSRIREIWRFGLVLKEVPEVIADETIATLGDETEGSSMTITLWVCGL